MSTELVAVACIAWYIFIACVCAIGYVNLFLYYRHASDRAAVLSKEKKDIPHVTVIRPCKGLEPYLYECLASTFLQDYPVDKITVHFCVSSRSDAACPIIEKVVGDYPNHDARMFVEEDDNVAELGSHKDLLGPNPKIRNMSRAYHEAKSDLIWIIDCNIWVGKGVCGRMVDTLCGFTTRGAPAKPYKLVHHLPISVDVNTYLGRRRNSTSSYDETSPAPLLSDILSRTFSLFDQYGSRLEELFLSSSHAKMYVAINTVAAAPCIVGKSNMFRRSHLDYLTMQRAVNEDPTSPLLGRTGIDYFSRNICEDHLIGDLLWKSKLPPLPGFPRTMRNHGLVFGDLAVQPVAGMTVTDYVARRVRWLRVRKFTVPVATLVEPGTESFLCSAFGAFGVTTCQSTRGMLGDTWNWLYFWWAVSLVLWASVDWTVYLLLHSGRTIETDTNDVPEFARPRTRRFSRRPFTAWLSSWVGREVLAFPIWMWAIWGGASVTWRDRRFWVGMDMKVHEISETNRASTRANESGRAVVGDVGSRTGLANGHAFAFIASPSEDANSRLTAKKRTD
ncbi:uncharacterized protein Z518_11340 [Rhinocladiella mackenziei CBS 650.93]|uniref:Ceramide glucosyltransferase n=1 Tax=Rhinocladiella mackenziei CBS 650.93 TaxID=1442369 RepID=A0A0D2GLU3_9EURO|nr:uncharacterized protein Z518_11340 [Rhinocladiella mackenziei CBS 650.93]KIW99352.1 hypothetical protein Z518_11340 [Rhinocladiella mackenziei CBS 650.93]